MIYLLLILEFIVLAYVARWVTQTLFLFFVRISGSRNVALTFTTLILFPGTVVHELSHLFIAEILGVRTGKLILTPEAIKNTDEEVRSGSVAIAQTGPIRRTIIGLAPMIGGMIVLMAISNVLDTTTTSIQILLYYLLFTVSNTLISSKEDMKGVIPVCITVGLFFATAYFAGLRIELTGQIAFFGTKLLESLTKSLGIVLAVNGVILLTLKLLLVPIGKLRSN